MNGRAWVGIALALVAIAGCNSGNRSGPRTRFGPGSGGTGGNTGGNTGGGGNIGNSVATIAVSQPTPPPASSLVGAGVRHAILAFRLESQNSAANVTVTGVTVTASGTIDESVDVLGLAVIQDANGNGRFDQGEAVLGTRNAPSFTQNDGTATITVNGLTIAPGQSVNLVVTCETTQPVGDKTDAAIPGRTIIFSLAGPLAITTTVPVAGAVATITGTPLNGTTVTLGIGTHLLISEVYAAAGGGTGQGAEFIEIFNPTGDVIDLTNYHLADYTQDVTAPATPTQWYWLLPSGAGFGPAGGGTSSDFSVRFPVATIQPGQFLVIAFYGDMNGFATQFANHVPAFALNNATGATQAMRVWDGVNGTFNFQPGNAGTSITLTDAGEPVFLFRWDGAANPPSDLITDVDVVGYGTTTAAGNNYMVSKTGKSCDTPPGGNPTAFANETDAATQNARRVPAGALTRSVQRTNYLEATETKTAGNGVGGHDETSEDWSQNFTTDTPTPGAP
jgi:hypothetical protein